MFYFILLFALPVFLKNEVPDPDTEGEIGLLVEEPSIPSLVDDGMTVCPFPPENAIEPCKCFMDKHLRFDYIFRGLEVIKVKCIT